MEFHRRPKTAEEWENEAPSVGRRARPEWNAEPTKGLHVRFNERELEELKELAKIEMTSQQRLLRKIVHAWLRAPKRLRTALLQGQDVTEP
jgi:hypothetical protein